MNNVVIEQVEETKLLGVTLDCKLSWSKHIDATVAKMGRGLSIIKHCSAILTILLTRQVLQPWLLSSRVVRCHKEGLRKIKIGPEQGRTATWSANINKTHLNLFSQSRGEIDFINPCFVRSIEMLNASV
jgi:hypothetical protein